VAEIERPRTPLWLVVVVVVLAAIGLLSLLRMIVGTLLWLGMLAVVIWLVFAVVRGFTRR
jgi:hypothetical protein